MPSSRRDLFRWSAVAAGAAILREPRALLAQATPEATPVASPDLLIAAPDLVRDVASVQTVAVMPAATFESGHIPGAIPLDWNALADTSEPSVAAWTGKMRELVAVAGIRADRPAVMVDEGSLFAARGWWQLAFLGYDLPRVLDGGMPAWQAAGGKVEQGRPAISPVEAPPIQAPVRRELLVTKEEVLAVLKDPGVVILDVRAPEEYAAGHIPGAKNLPYTRNASDASPHLFLSPDKLRAMYAALGVSPDKRAITYCSTGVRGSVGFFSLRLAGFPNVALYVGSWNEWGSDPATPKEKS